MEYIQAVLQLFNHVESLQPIIENNIDEVFTGKIFQRIINFLCDEFPEDQTSSEDNKNEFLQPYQLTYKLMTQINQQLEDYYLKNQIIHEHVEIDLLKIIKSKDMNETLKLFKLVLQAFMKGNKSDQFLQCVQQLGETQLQQIASLFTQDEDQNQAQQNINFFTQPDQQPSQLWNKLQEQESEILNLKQKLQLHHDDFESQQQKYLINIDHLKQEKYKLIESSSDRENKQIEILDKLQCTSLDDVLIHYEQKVTTINQLQKRIETYEKELKQKDDDHLEKIQVTEQQALHLNKKLSSYQRTETSNEKLQDILQQTEEYYERYNEECIQHKKTQQKLKDLQSAKDDKCKKYKKSYLEEKSQREKYEFEITRIRDNQSNLVKQVEQRESQIQMLNTELTKLEDQNEYLQNDNSKSQPQSLQQQGVQSINNSLIMHSNALDNDNNFVRRVSISNMMGYKRNLSIQQSPKQGVELVSLISKAITKDTDDQVQKSKFSAQPNRINESVQNRIYEADSDSDTEQNRCDVFYMHNKIQVDYWKSKAEVLQQKVLELEESINIQKHTQNNVINKFQVFINQQEQYQRELNEAQMYFKTYSKDIEDREAQIANLITEKEQLASALNENGRLLQQLTQQINLSNIMNIKTSNKDKKTPDKHQVQLLEKQNKIMKKKYQEEINQKDNMLQLVTSALLELQSGVIAFKHGNLEHLLKDDTQIVSSMLQLDY